MIYIDTKSTDPYFNFALEEYFCTENIQNDTIFLLWQTDPTVMIGNFQNSFQELDLAAVERDHIHVIRRNTGGGTIYTDRGSFQFSFIMPGTNQMIDFGKYMDPIIAALKQLGVTAEYNSRNDLSINGSKFSGNAQCVKGNCTLHHGSLLYEVDFSRMSSYLRPPSYKIESKGITSVRERTTNLINHVPEPWSAAEFHQKLITAILQDGAQNYSLSSEDITAIENLANMKFRSWEWNFGRNPDFTLKKSRHFSGGQLEIELCVKHGLITDCRICGDFFSAHGVEDLEKALIGNKYTIEALAPLLSKTEFQRLIYQITPEDILTCLFS